MCQHNARFDEWWAKQVDNGGTWTTLERLAAKDAWEAATKLVEEKFTSTNTPITAAPQICPLCNMIKLLARGSETGQTSCLVDVGCNTPPTKQKAGCPAFLHSVVGR